MMNKFGSYLKDYLDFNNISVKEFAERIDSTPKNLIDILNGKIELSKNIIYNISFVTEIPVSFIENLESNHKLDKQINIFLKTNKIDIKEYLKKFNYKELKEKYNLEYKDERDNYFILKDIMQFLRITNLEQLYKNNNGIFYKSNNDKPELLALWLEKCYKLTLEQKTQEYNKNNIDNLVNYIVSCAKKNIFNEKELIYQFNLNGIYLVILDDLKGSKIRGAFKVLNDKPAIFLTRKHKRYADIYFALLHELAHCKSDFNRAKSGSIVSIIDNKEIEEYELKADHTAFDWMIPNNEYDKIKKDLTLINNSNYPKSFIVYRLAHDKVISYNSKLYQNNNKIII